MKFLYFGDKHERPDVPENRTDDYHASVNAKTAEIKELAKKHQVRALLQPGDFLHKPKYSYEFLGDLVKRWSTVDIYDMLGDLMSGRVSAEDVAETLKNWTPILGAVGNHELYGEALKSYPKTSLAFLEKIGFMHFPTKEKPFIFTDEDGLTVAVTAMSYDIGMDSEDRINDYIIEEKAGDIHIHIVHGYLTNKDMGDMFPHTVLDAIAHKTKADLTISGHDHIGFPLTEVDGKYFINPGAPVRMKNDKKEMKRRPKVLLIEATKEKGLSVKSIYLKSAEKGEDVLSREKVEERDARNAQMEEIKSIVNKAQLTGGANIKEIIREIASNKNLDDSIKDKAIELVSDKMDVIQNATTKASPYKIERVVLENFKSHVYSDFELSAGLNVFVGESGAGKSSIMSAFDWVYENAGRNPRRFIHHGKDYAKVSLYLSNGYVISRVVDKKKSGKNGYEVYNPITAQVEEYNTKSLELIQELLGFTKLDIDTEKDIPLNFQRQGDGWFFIGGGFTPSMRAKVIGSVYQTHFVDAVLKDLEAETKKLNQLEKEKGNQLKETEERIAGFDHLEESKKNLAILEHKMAQVKLLKDKRQSLSQKYDELCHVENKIAIKEQELAQLDKIEEAVEKMKDLMTRSATRNMLLDKQIRLEKMREEAGVVKTNLKNLESVEKARGLLEMVEEKSRSRNQLKDQLLAYGKLETEGKSLKASIDRLEGLLKKLEGIEKADEKLRTLRLLVADRLRLAEKVHELDIIKQEGVRISAQYKEADKHLKDVANEYKKLLEKVGSCPVCRSTIDKNRIENILAVQVG